MLACGALCRHLFFWLSGTGGNDGESLKAEAGKLILIKGPRLRAVGEAVCRLIEAWRLAEPHNQMFGACV